MAWPASKRYCKNLSMSCKGQETASNPLSLHHEENRTKQFSYTILVEGALALCKVLV